MQVRNWNMQIYKNQATGLDKKDSSPYRYGNSSHIFYTT